MGQAEVDQFIEMTGADSNVAEHYLVKHENVLDAINAYLDKGSGGGGSGGGGRSTTTSSASASVDGQVTVECGYCGQNLRVPVGTPAVKCPKCGGVSSLKPSDQRF